MATRFYLPSDALTVPVSPAFAGGWENTSIADRTLMHIVKRSSAMATRSYADADATNQQILFKHYICPFRLASQAIAAAAVRLQMRCSETNAGNNLTLMFGARSYPPDGVTATSTLRTIVTAGTGTEMTTSLTNRVDNPTLTAGSAVEGGWLTVEIGAAGDPAAGQSHSSSIRFGDSNGTDLPQDESTTTDNDPWIEFSSNIIFMHSRSLCGLGC